MLIMQLDPPSLKPMVLKASPSREIIEMVRDVVGLLVGVTLATLSMQGSMENVSLLAFGDFV